MAGGGSIPGGYRGVDGRWYRGANSPQHDIERCSGGGGSRFAGGLSDERRFSRLTTAFFPIDGR